MPHYVVVILACLCAAAPFLVDAIPAKYAAIGPAVLAIVAALKVNALGQGEQKDGNP
jgi:hypothetical protein